MNDETLCLRWRATSRHPLQWLLVLFGSCMIPAVFFMPFALMQTSAPEVPLPAAIGISLLMLLLCVSFLYYGFRCRGHEQLTLSPQTIEYDTGPTVLPWPFLAWFGPGLLLGPQLLIGPETAPLRFRRRKYCLALKKAGPFMLERIGPRQRLRVDDGADRIEIGHLLREPEREWLAEQLQEWQSQIMPAADS